MIKSQIIFALKSEVKGCGMRISLRYKRFFKIMRKFAGQIMSL